MYEVSDTIYTLERGGDTKYLVDVAIYTKFFGNYFL